MGSGVFWFLRLSIVYIVYVGFENFGKVRKCINSSDVGIECIVKLRERGRAREI